MANKRASFDLIVFDWDGTLLNSADHIVRALQGAFRDNGLLVPDYSAARYVVGLSLEQALTHLVPTLSHADRQAVARAYHLRYHQAHQPVLYDGVGQWLPSLQQAGYQLAIATGASRLALNRVLQETMLLSFFAVTRTADEAFAKPHPQMLNDILAMTGVDPQRAVMVGDTIHDLQMATNAGCAAVAMSYGAHTVAALQIYSPLCVFDDFRALGAWLIAAENEKQG